MPSARSPRRAFFSSWRWRGWLAAFVALALATGAIPLVGVLGYELALIAAIAASLAGLDLGSAYARHAQRVGIGDETRGPLRATARLAADAVLATWVPLAAWGAIAAARGLWTPTCDWWFGLTTFVWLPVASGALAAVTGLVIGLAVGPRPALGTVAALAVAVAFVAAGLLRFYGAPPVFSYSPLVGYFPGNLYDERIELGRALWWARLEAGCWALALLALAAAGLDVATARWRGRRALPAAPRGRGAAAGLALALAGAGAALHHRAGALGYAVDAEDLQRALSGRLETPHFVIHYADTPAIRRDLTLLAEDHELRLAQVTRALGVEPSTKIRSYYFRDGEQKARWMGARDVEMAKPWRREIYLEHREFPHPSLRHEIAHVVAAEFGDPWFRVSARRVAGVPLLVNPGLIEGVAVAADWPGSYERELTPHQAVRAMQELGLSPSVADLFSLAFLSLSSARSYTAAGSFARFLLERRGASALRELYRNGGDFVAAYGAPAAELEAQWRAELERISLPPEQIEATRERFRQVGVFARPCPHAVADRRARAYEAAARGERGAAVDLLRRVCSDSPAEPRYRMELGDLLQRGDDEEQREAAELWGALERSERVTTSLRAELLDRLASAAATRGELAEARARLDAALALAVSDGQRRQLEAKRLAVTHAGPAGPALRSYFFAPGDARAWAERAVAAEPALGFALYLRALRQAETRAWGAMAEDLERGLQLGLPSTSFVRNAARRLAVAAYRSADTRRVRLAADTLRGAGMTETDRLLAEDWLARLAFAEARGATSR
ncbi:MAG: hypothetical protein R3B48_01365 [Kofleriaceae bacterium]